MNKKYFLLLLLLCSAFALTAQSGKQKKADRLYDDFAYVKAIEVYKDLVERDYNTTYNQQRIADSYYKLRDPQNAVQYYAQVVNKPDVSPEAYYKYAQMLRGMREYDKSREWLKKYQEEAKNPKEVEELLDPESITTYEGLESFRVQPGGMNSQYSDFGTFVSDGTVYFVSARGEADTRTKIYDWTGEPFLDIYKTSENGSVNAVSGEVNTVRHEGPLTISADGKTMYFTRNNYMDNRNGKKDEQGVNHLKIYKAKLVDGKWDDIEELPFSSDTYSVGHPSLSADGKTLYFASDAPGGLGGSDIYKVSIDGDSYGTPENLGAPVNTPGNEVFPYAAKNGNFYFSSDGHKGYGLLDIFVMTEEAPEKIQNLGEPINSSLDDFGFSFSSEDDTKGYISSNREGGMGNDDIYEMTILAPLVLKGQVTDSINGKPIANATVRLMDENDEQIAFLETDEDGNYSTEIARDRTYPLEAKHIKYNTKTDEINTANMDEREELVYDIELAPIRDVEYLAEINKIYFDFDKSNIRPDAAKELDKLVDLMKNDYPELVIEIGSHTDKRGSVEYNRKLAERRAQSTYDYLVEHGIAPERIVTYKGYGEMKPDVDCMTCNEEQHQLNRRSVFKVVKME
ncbi:WD40-like Beta Propeller Repeat [Salinimicrobium catena]|uniref:WD40-like Beta Propeller Repeat n=1 Tax=Salinimicrobium catena TaxID=390640 RepID=A0A1H5NXF4_9FLAO|nr:OmpA family protein [Salinimicrobium catena]SDL58261.1 WD40-like Beta Propeller Repeat [Salinimicrobium catena]SEF06130.1 WD40-like Beta Propeller Repeat [Salinimicrobium catena]